MRQLMRIGIGAATAVALVFSTAVVAHAEPDDSPELQQQTVLGDIAMGIPSPDELPAVESEVGRGSALSTDSDALVGLGASAVGYSSALVRVAVLSPVSETTVFRSGGIPVLRTAPGVSASSTALLPVDAATGEVVLWGSAPADVRIEVLAAFGGGQQLPGSTLALEEPVLRANTGEGLAGNGIGGQAIKVGLVGEGGVPSERVRSVYVTAELTLDAAATLEFGAQRFPVASGTTVFTTIVAPDEDGTIEVRADGGSGQLKLHVIGWIPEAPEQASQLSLVNSFVPTARLDEHNTQTLHPNGSGAARDDFAWMARNSDAIYTVGLVTLTATAETETTLFDFGPAYEGRARGAVVDRAVGTAPQLVVVPVSDTSDGFTLRRGGAKLDWLPVGDFLGEEHFRPAGDALAIEIDTHEPGQAVDLGEHGYFTLGGTIGTSRDTASIDRVEVSGPEGLIGTADVTVERGELRWSFDAAAPEDGEHEYTVEVFDRSGHSRETGIELDLEAADEDDVVVTPDLWLLNDEEGMHEVRVTADEPDTAYVSANVPIAPGDILISDADASAGLPEGLLVEVVSFDRIGDEWRVRTVPGAIDNVFFQVSVDMEEMLDDELLGTEIDDEVEDASIVVEEEDGTEIVGEVSREDGDSGYAVAEVLSGDEVDVDPLECVYPVPEGAVPPEECQNIDEGDIQPALGYLTGAGNGPQAIPAAMRPAATLDIGNTFGVKANVTLLSGERTLSQSPKLNDLAKNSNDPDAELQKAFNEMTTKDEAGLTVALAGQISPKLTFVLETHMTWKWGFIPTGVVVDKFKIQFSVTFKGQFTVQLYYKFQKTLKAYNKIAGFKLPTITIPAGPVPIVIFNEIEVALQTQTKLQATLTASYSITRVDTWGTEYTDAKGKWEALSVPTQTSSQAPIIDGLSGVELKFAGEFSIGPVITAKSQIYGLAGPELSVTAAIGLSGSLVFNDESGYLQFLLFGRLTAGAKFKFEFLSLKWEVDVWGAETTLEIWKWRHYFYQPPKTTSTGWRSLDGIAPELRPRGHPPWLEADTPVAA